MPRLADIEAWLGLAGTVGVNSPAACAGGAGAGDAAGDAADDDAVKRARASIALDTMDLPSDDTNPVVSPPRPSAGRLADRMILYASATTPCPIKGGGVILPNRVRLHEFHVGNHSCSTEYAVPCLTVLPDVVSAANEF